MGMTIDEARIALGKERKYALHENKQAFDIAIDVMRKYQMMQADYNARLKGNNELINDLEEVRTMINKFAESYEARLKAEMVAMLTEIQLEIEELDTPSNGDAYMTCSDIIQQKINALTAGGAEKE